MYHSAQESASRERDTILLLASVGVLPRALRSDGKNGELRAVVVPRLTLLWVRAIRKYCHIVPGVFTPVLAKHTKHLSLVDILSVGVDHMPRKSNRWKKQVEACKGTRLPDEAASWSSTEPLWRVGWMFPGTCPPRP
jgi:hypothetical protein